MPSASLKTRRVASLEQAAWLFSNGSAGKLAVVDAVSDESSLFVDQLDDLAIQIKQVFAFDARRFDVIDGRGQDPRMATVKRQRFPRLQDDASGRLRRRYGWRRFH
jgi:hypothetical protein